MKSSDHQRLKFSALNDLLVGPGTYLPAIFPLQRLARIVLCTDAVNPSASAYCLKLPVPTLLPEA